MFSFTKEIASGVPRNPCAALCRLGLGEGELVVMRQVLGVCLRIGLRLGADCPSSRKA